MISDAPMDSSYLQEEDVYVTCFLKLSDNEQQVCQTFINNLAKGVRASGGKIQMLTQRAKDWDIYDGRENFISPNHLSPASLDFNCILVAAFPGLEVANTWWNSDQMFNTLKNREGVEKIGVYVFDGLREAFDVTQYRESGDRFLFLEIISMQSFQQTQRYLDLYKRFAEKAIIEIGMDCNLLFAESAARIFLNEFPIDAVCASAWRLKTDPKFWYESASYQQQLLPLRQGFTSSFAALVPVMDDRPKESKAAGFMSMR